MGCGCGKRSVAPSSKVVKSPSKPSGSTPKRIRRVIRKTK